MIRNIADTSDLEENFVKLCEGYYEGETAVSMALEEQKSVLLSAGRKAAVARLEKQMRDRPMKKKVSAFNNMRDDISVARKDSLPSLWHLFVCINLITNCGMRSYDFLNCLYSCQFHHLRLSLL